MRTDQSLKPMERVSAILFQGAKELWKAGVDFAYPPACFLCGDDFGLEGEDRFCPTCFRDVAPFIPHACERCGAEVGPNLNTMLGCIHCKTTPFHFQSLVRLGLYKDLLRRSCLAIKRPGQEPLTEALAELFWSRESDRLAAANLELAVSVPKHWTSRLFIAHNPAETLARALARRLKIPYAGRAIKKTRRTPKQSSLPPSRRVTNLREAFRVRQPRLIAGRNVLLVDDVLTTGTTVNRIARLLKKAGAKSITVAVLARGVGDVR